jgi:hypothetical protein
VLALGNIPLDCGNGHRSGSCRQANERGLHMTRAEALDALIAKVEAGDEFAFEKSTQDVFGAYRRSETAQLAYRAFNGSLDAAKALHEAVLPGWRVGQIGQQYAHQDDPSDAWSVWIVAPDYLTTCAQASAQGPCPARAWLLAILRALHAMEGAQP